MADSTFIGEREAALRRLFEPFADPMTRVSIQGGQTAFEIKLTRDGESRSYSIEGESGRITRRAAQPTHYATLESLLASPEFANLRSMAQTQRRLLDAVGKASYLKPALTIGDSSTRVGESEFRDLLTPPDTGKLRIILVDGPAGIGKTFLLQRVAYDIAVGASKAGDVAPILYVSSRGRRLSNIRDTLAGTTQQIRAEFTFDQVPVLVRRGLLRLAIDGFDELVDSDGYEDAWYTLRELIEEVRGGEARSGGVCILAGRDTFFDQQAFLRKLKEAGEYIDLHQVHLLAAQPEDARRWLIKKGWSVDDTGSDVSKVLLGPTSYLLRPYFLSTLADSGGWREAQESGSPRKFLITRFLGREARLVAAMVQIDEQTAVNCLSVMFREAAADMAERDSNEIELEYLGMLCELAFGQALHRDDLGKLKHKAGSFALLEQGASARFRRFPHSEVFYYFLARSIIADLSKGLTPTALRRGVLGSDFQEVFQDVIENDQDAGAAISRLRTILATELSFDNVPSTTAALLLTSLSSLPQDDLTINGIDINECLLRDTVGAAILKNLTIFRLDARNANLTNVTFEDCRVSSLVADDLTVFGSTSPHIDAVHATRLDSVANIRVPKEVADWLESHSRREQQEREEPDLIRFFDKICRRGLSRFYFSDNVDDVGGRVTRDPNWPIVEETLRRHGRLDIVKRDTSGPGTTKLFHIIDPQSLLVPKSEDIESMTIRNEIRQHGLIG